MGVPQRRHKRRRQRRRERPHWIERAFTYEQEQLSLARAVQQRLLAPPLLEIPGTEMVARFLPSASISGDFFDCFTLPSRQLGLYLGDVEGKGLEAAMYALLVSGMMRGLHKSDQEPVEVLRLLNERLLERGVPGKFCCFGYALFDLRGERVRFANCGLPSPWLIRDGRLTTLRSRGFPLGMFDELESDQVELDWRPGDSLVFHSDGLPDSLQLLHRHNAEGEQQLVSLLRASPKTSAATLSDYLLARLRRRARGRGRQLPDDVTLVVVRFPRQ